MKKHFFLFVATMIAGVSTVLYAQEAQVRDSFWKEPQDTYDERLKIGLEYIRDNSTTEGLYGLFGQLARVGLGEKPDEHVVLEAVETIRRNRDCNDFIANGLLRLMYVNQEREIFSSEMSTLL